MLDKTLQWAEGWPSRRYRQDPRGRNQIRNVTWLSSRERYDSKQSHWAKAKVNKLPYVEILNTIREIIFGKKLLDIQASEIESRLNKFWLNMNNGDSFDDWLDDWSLIDPIYLSAEVTIKQRCKRQRFNTYEKLYIYKQVVDLNTPIKEILWKV